ncbi:MAG: hypothetical protein AAFV53_25635 [Myxococcota bacterium]
MPFLILIVGELLAIAAAIGAQELFRRGRRGLAVGLWILSVALVMPLSVLTLASLGGGFGAGSMTMLGNLCLAPMLVPLLWFVAGGWTMLKQPGARLGSVIGLLGLTAAMCGPVVGSQTIKRRCARRNQDTARPIIDAVLAYRQQNGRYPDRLAELSGPLPAPKACGRIDEDFSEYMLEHCTENIVLLTFYSTGGSTIERYNFASNEWDSPISFLDGACNHLKEQ